MFFLASAIVLFEIAFGLTAVAVTALPVPLSVTTSGDSSDSSKPNANAVLVKQDGKSESTSSEKNQKNLQRTLFSVLQNHGLSLCAAYALNFAEASGSALTKWLSRWVLAEEGQRDGSPLAFLGNVGVFLLLADFGFYWTHRALHQVPCLRPFHAKHHRWHSDLIPLAGLDSSVQEHIWNVFALSFPVFLGVRLTWSETHAIAAIVGVNIALTHSSKLQSFRHVAHHLNHHRVHQANFGATFLFDAVFKTLWRAPQEKDTAKIA